MSQIVSALDGVDALTAEAAASVFREGLAHDGYEAWREIIDRYRFHSALPLPPSASARDRALHLLVKLGVGGCKLIREPSVLTSEGTVKATAHPPVELSPIPNPPKPPPPGQGRPLSIGADGDDVDALQEVLIQLGYLDPSAVDKWRGHFGPRTRDAVVNYQFRRVHLHDRATTDPIGEVGIETWEALCADVQARRETTTGVGHGPGNSNASCFSPLGASGGGGGGGDGDAPHAVPLEHNDSLEELSPKEASTVVRPRDIVMAATSHRAHIARKQANKAVSNYTWFHDMRDDDAFGGGIGARTVAIESQLRNRVDAIERATIVVIGGRQVGLTSLTDVFTGRKFPEKPSKQELRLRSCYLHLKPTKALAHHHGSSAAAAATAAETTVEALDGYGQGGVLVKVQVRDKRASATRTPFSWKLYSGNSTAVLICFDLTAPADSPSSLTATDHFLREVLEARSPADGNPLPIILVGTKADDAEHRSVSEEEAADFARQRGLQYCEVSAKSGLHATDRKSVV